MSNLVKKAGYNTKISEIEKKNTDHDHSNKHITTQEFDKFTAQIFAARLTQANLASKSDIAALVKKKDFDDKLKNLLQRKQNMYLLEINLKNYEHLIQVFSSVKANCSIMKHNFTLTLIPNDLLYFKETRRY